MSDELNSMIMGARLGYDIAKDIVKALEAIIKASKPDAKVEFTEKTDNYEDKHPAVSVGNEHVRVRCELDESVKAIENGETTVEEEAQKIAEQLEPHLSEENLESVEEKIKLFDNPEPSRIRLEAISAARNEELLKGVPHTIVAEDIAIIARYDLGEGASTKITNELAQRLGYTPKEVLDYGSLNIKNEGYSVTNMGQMIADMMGMPYDKAEEMFPNEQGMLVVTNETKIHGAAGIFTDKNLRAEVSEKLGGDFMVLPSSIHETICVRADALTSEQAKEMIVEVNGSQLAPSEVLSEHAYHVDGKTLQITSLDNMKKQEDIAEIATAVKKAAAHR